jgi:hypothetical protein
VLSLCLSRACLGKLIVYIYIYTFPGYVSRTAGDDLLQLVEERLESILLEGEECLAGFLLGGEDAIDVGNLRWVGRRVGRREAIVAVRLAREEEGAEVVAARYKAS